MRPIDYWDSLKTEQRRTAYCERAGSTYKYLSKHLFNKSSRKRNPRMKTLIKLAEASEGNVTLDEAIDYFLVQPVKELAREMQSSSQPTPRAGQVKNKGFDGVSADNHALSAG